VIAAVASLLTIILPRIKPRSRTPEPVELRDKSLSWSFFEGGQKGEYLEPYEEGTSITDAVIRLFFSVETKENYSPEYLWVCSII
jgi:hypothetical protein